MFYLLKWCRSSQPWRVVVRVRIVDLLAVGRESPATAAIIVRPQVGVVRKGRYTKISYYQSRPSPSLIVIIRATFKEMYKCVC